MRAYLIGMMLAGTVGKDHALIRRLRTITVYPVTRALRSPRQEGIYTTLHPNL